MARGGSFYQLPDELLVKIFTYLDKPDLVLNVQHVDSRWKMIVQDNAFWRDYVFTFGQQMADEEIILLLQNMPYLRALVAERGTSTKLIHTVCKTCKFVTHLELHKDHKFTTFHLEKLVKHLPNIQHFAFPLSWRNNENAPKYSMLLQQFQGLLSLKLLGSGFETQNCQFLSEIAKACPLLHDIDLGQHEFETKDIICFLEAKKSILSRFVVKDRITAEVICHLGTCKQLETLHFSFFEGVLPLSLLLEFPNLKELAITNNASDSPIMRHLDKVTLSNILTLELSEMDLNSTQFESTLQNCKHLKSLILRYVSLPNDDDFQHIAKCLHLEYLDICNCRITDVIVEIFSTKCKKLTHLDMTYCYQVTDNGLYSLMKCSELRILRLNGTEITGQNFHLIPQHLTKLHELQVEFCEQLDLKHVKQLQEEMKHLQVYATYKAISEDFEDFTDTRIFAENLSTSWSLRANCTIS